MSIFKRISELCSGTSALNTFVDQTAVPHKLTRQHASAARVCRFETMEPRQMLSGDGVLPNEVLFGSVYFEEATGDDSEADIIQVSFEGGAEGTVLNRLTISGDKKQNGISEGDIFFDTTTGGMGAFNAVGLTIQSHDGFEILGFEVTDGGTDIVITFRGFEAGEKLLFSIDADEYQFIEEGALADGQLTPNEVDTNSLVEGGEFQRSILTGSFTAPHHVDLTLKAKYWDAYDSRFTAAQTETNLTLNLPKDAYSSTTDFSDRTAGAIAHAPQLELATLSGYVYYDKNNDGLFTGAGEIGIGGVQIELLDAAGNGTGIFTTTSADPTKLGFYEFTDLTPGTYGVKEVTQPTDYLDGKETAGTHGGTAAPEPTGRVDQITAAVLVYGSHAKQYNFGEIKPGSIRGRVHASNTNECNFERPDQLLSGVKIDLLDAAGNLLKTTLTDSLGEYEFTGLLEGEYQVYEHQPVDYFDGSERAGSLGGEILTNDKISKIVLTSGEHGTGYDFCEHIGASLTGWVYHDQDNNGVFNKTTENGLGGVTLELLDASGNPTGLTTTTNASGFYKFENLTAGTYGVRETQPTDYLDGKDSAGTHGGTAADESTGPVDRIEGATLLFGDLAEEYNFGEVLPSKISGRVHADNDGNCLIDADDLLLAGVKIDLLDAAGTVIASTTTNSLGEYEFTNLKPGEYQIFEHQPTDYYDGDEHVGSAGGEILSNDKISKINLLSGTNAENYDFCEHVGASISGWVYHDQSNEGLFNRATETGIAQVTLKLLDENGHDTGKRAVTNSNGFYEFTNLAAGKYSIHEIQPESYLDGIDTAGNLGGNAATAVGADKISEIMIEFGQKGVEYNFGELLPGSIRGHVGICDNTTPNDAPISGVVIQLLNTNGELLASTTTDTAGNYAFENLPPGHYQVREIQPIDYFNGSNDIGTGGGTQLAQDHVGEIVLESGNNHTEYDFCEVSPGRISGYVFVDGAPIISNQGLPKDLTTVKDGLRTADDRPLAGVTVRLLNGFGDPIFGEDAQVLPGRYPAGPITTVTDANGYYEFTGLGAATFSVAEIQPENEQLYDGLDTQGSKGGQTLNPQQLTDGALPQTGLHSQNSLRTLAKTLNNDAILGIFLAAGQESVSNNFSEVEVTPFGTPPKETPPIDPPVIIAQPDLVLPNYLAPQVFLTPPSFSNFGGSSAVGYTWHLSVIDAGMPRQAAQNPAARHYLASVSFDVIAWRQVKLDQGTWTLAQDQNVHVEHLRTLEFGNKKAIPVSGDFNGDGKDEIGIYVDGQWYLDINGNGRWDDADLWAKLGTRDDLPVTGDWDADGKDDIGIYGPAWARDPRAIESDPGLPDSDNTRQHTFLNQKAKTKNIPPTPEEATLGARAMKRSARGNMRADLIDHVFHYGNAGDTPIAGDWNGDGVKSIGIFRNGQWHLDTDGDGRFTKSDAIANFGQAGDIPVVGDWNGDGIDEIGVFRAGQWIVDSNGDQILNAVDQVFELGTAGDIPVVGDWDGDGTDDPAVYTPNGSTGNPLDQITRDKAV